MHYALFKNIISPKCKTLFLIGLHISDFVSKKVYFVEILLHYIITKKSAAEADMIIVETYGDHALSGITCRDWLTLFKNNHFNVEHKERSDATKKFENEESEALHHEDSCPAQSELTESFGVDHRTVSKRLKALRLIQKQGHRVPNELKPRNIERRLVTCDQQLQRQKKKGF